MTLPEVTARLDADVDGFIRAWDRAADAAERAAARIRAAQQGLGDVDIDSDRFRDLDAELNRLTRTARAAADAIRDFGNNTRNAGDGVDELGERARRAGDGMGDLGRSAGGAGMNMKVMAAAVAVIASVLPAVAAAALAGGAALQALGVAGAVVAAGWKGIEQAAERLGARLAGLKKQLESIFRAGLSQEFSKLGEAIRTLDAPIKDIARSIVGVVKEFTGWIRSSQGLREIETMLDGVNNFVKQLGPGAKALAQAFTGFGAAAAPALGDIGKALSSVFENLNKVIQKNKESGQLGKAFENGAKAIEAFGEILATIVDIIIDVAAEAGGPATDAVKDFGGSLKAAKPAITEMFVELAEAAKIFMKIVRVISEVVGAVGTIGKAFREAGEAVAKFVTESKAVKDIGAAVAGAFEAVKKAVADGVTGAVEAVKKWWEDTKTNIEKGVEGAKKAVEKWWEDTKKAIKKGVDDAIATVKKWLDALNKDPEKAGRDFVKAVKKWWDDTVKAVKKGVDDTIKSIKEWARKLIEDAKKGWNDFVRGVQEWWDDTGEEIKAGVDKAVDFIEQLPDKAMQALSDWVSDMKQIGKDAIEGIAEGIESAVSTLVGAATKAAKAALGAIKETLGIASPSRVFAEEVGAMIPAGIAEGIIGNAGLVTDAMRRAGLTSVGASRGAAFGGAAALGRSATPPVQVVVTVGAGADSAMGTAIAKLARTGQLKLTANAVKR